MQYFCTKILVSKDCEVCRFCSSYRFTVVPLLDILFFFFFVLVLFNIRVSETKRILVKGGYRQKSKQSSLSGLFSFI